MWLLSQIPSIISKSPARKTLRKIQIFPSAQQEFGAKCEEPSPEIRNRDKHQGWFHPAPLQRDWEHNTLEKHHNPMADPLSLLWICRTSKIQRNQVQLKCPSRRKWRGLVLKLQKAPALRREGFSEQSHHNGDMKHNQSLEEETPTKPQLSCCRGNFGMVP